ncbi:hypothetical protein BU16DRAFT_619781 [Lophium mytilinum]|uniref:Uncharacterized protein n=1 Tax=Lophium mytilinum TaxID=390894 RepID=A0A6A6QM37_9PEZI|nr:hypothetical protein BU16DRAFT_619781 [Lophium mytilinum]
MSEAVKAMDEDWVAQFDEFLLSDSDCAAADASRKSSAYYDKEYLPSDPLLKYQDDLGMAGFLNGFYEVVLRLVQLIPYKSSKQNSIIELLSELRQLSPKEVKIWEEDCVVWTREPVSAVLIEDNWNGNYPSDTKERNGGDGQHSFLEVCSEWVNFSSFLARYIKAGLRQGSQECWKYPEVDISKALEHDLPRGPKRDSQIMVAAQYVLLGGKELADHFIESESVGLGPDRWRRWAGKLAEISRQEETDTLVASVADEANKYMVYLHSELFSESLSYKDLSSLDNYHLPSWKTGPVEVPEPKEIFTPSNLTLEIENGDIKNVPSHLKKETPDFHLLMPATKDNSNFCKTVLSAMIMDYPAPTIINFKEKFKNTTELERAKVKNIVNYLSDRKNVRNDDLVMIVDGQDVYFQLPSEVLVKEYQNILAEANRRLRDKYGYIHPKDEVTRAMYNQTVIWGADKLCGAEQGNATVCPTVPESPLPTNAYGLKTDDTELLSRAKYLNAGTVIGPAKDLRAIFASALPMMVEVNGTEPTAQLIFSNLFSKQETAREEALKAAKTAPGAWRGWLSSKTNPSAEQNTTAPPRLEFSMGLDYAHVLFQPTTSTAPKELLSRPHSEMQTLHHVDTPTPPLTLPDALLDLPPPYHTLDPSKDPSPNPLPYLIKPLVHDDKLDELPAANKPWVEIQLWTNTYTGAVPALLHLNHAAAKPKGKTTLENPTEINPNEKREDDDEKEKKPEFAIDWKDMWFYPHARALARSALRIEQGSLAWHAAAVGGDSWWDMRGGKGGVWAVRGRYLGWGEGDGVCGGNDMVESVFGDGKGPWLQEGEAERMRLEAAEAIKKAQEEQERQKQEEERKKQEEENKKKQEEEEKRKQEEAEKNKKVEEAKKKVQEAEAKKEAEDKKKSAEDKKKADEEMKKFEADQKQEDEWDKERKKLEGDEAEEKTKLEGDH